MNLHRSRVSKLNSGVLKGLAKLKKSTKRDNYGSGWVGPGLALNFFGENRSNIVLYTIKKKLWVSKKIDMVCELYPDFFGI